MANHPRVMPVLHPWHRRASEHDTPAVLYVVDTDGAVVTRDEPFAIIAEVEALEGHLTGGAKPNGGDVADGRGRGLRNWGRGRPGSTQPVDVPDEDLTHRHRLAIRPQAQACHPTTV